MAYNIPNIASNDQISLSNSGPNGTIITDSGGEGISVNVSGGGDIFIGSSDMSSGSIIDGTYGTIALTPSSGGSQAALTITGDGISASNLILNALANSDTATNAQLTVYDSTPGSMGSSNIVFNTVQNQYAFVGIDPTGSLNNGAASTPDVTLYDGINQVDIFVDGANTAYMELSSGATYPHPQTIEINATTIPHIQINDNYGGGSLYLSSTGGLPSMLLGSIPKSSTVEISATQITTNSNSIAGKATITNPALTIAVVYNVAFTATLPPIVVVTALGADPSALGGVWITNQGSTLNWTGFTINVTTSPASSQDFNYHVVGSY